MTYLFMEESGDLGFGKGSSRWFLFVIVITKEPRMLEKIHRKVWQTLRNKHSHPGELHATKESDVTRRRMFRMIRDFADLNIVAVILDKKKIRNNLRHDKHALYNISASAVVEALEELQITDGKSVNICIDRRETNEGLRDDFAHYLAQSAKSISFDLSFAFSHQEKSLQIADFIAWAIFRNYERSDGEWYDFIQKRIISETVISLENKKTPLL